MKILRWAIGIIVVILILVVVGIVLLVNFINPNDYRDQISQTVSQKIHKPLVIQGDISWLFFPELGFKVQDVVVGDSSGKDLYAKINLVELNLQIFPLLHKQIALDALRIDGLQMTLPASATSPEAKPTSESTASTSPAAALAAFPQLSLLEFSIKHANISQLNASGKTAWAIKDLSLDGTNIGVDHQFPIQFKLNAFYPEKNLNATIRFASEVDWQTSDQLVLLKSLKLMIDTDKSSTPPINLVVESPKIAANLSSHTLAADAISGSLNELNFSAKGTVKNFDTAPDISADWNMNTPNLRTFMHGLGIDLPATLPNATDQFTLKTYVEYGSNQLTLNPFSVRLGKNTIDGQIKSVDIKNMAMTMNLKSAVLNAFGAAVNGLQINLSALPPPGADKDWLASTVNGSITAQSGSYQQQPFSNFQLQLDGKNKIFKLLKLHTNIFGGSVDSTGIVNMQSSSAKFTINPNVQNIQVQDLLKIVEPKFDLTGLASLNGSISSQGTALPMIKRNLNGNLKVFVKNGVLHGLDVGYWANMASDLYHGHFGSALQQPEGSSTQFGNLSATLAINQGVISNKDFLLQGPIAQVKGAGTIDLNRESLNYHVEITKTNRATGKQHADVVPLIITGSFDQPKIQPDMAAISKAILLNQKDQVVKKVMGEDLANSPLGQQVSGVLGQILG